MDLLKDIKDGIRYLYMGQCLFFRDRSLWKYALLPLLFLAFIYIGFIIVTAIWIYPAFVSFFTRCANKYIPILSSFPSVAALIMAIWVFLLIWTTVGVLYQCFAAFTFDSLSEAFEEKYFNYSGDGTANTAGMFTDGILLSSRNCVFYLGLVLLSLAVPGLGHAACIILLGYLTGIANLQACASNHGVRSRQILRDSSSHFTTVSVAGIIAVLLDGLPFVSFLFAPGFVLAGCLLYNDKVLGQSIKQNI